MCTESNTDVMVMCTESNSDIMLVDMCTESNSDVGGYVCIKIMLSFFPSILSPPSLFYPFFSLPPSMCKECIHSFICIIKST